LLARGVEANMEKNFVDVDFKLEGEHYIGEIKVTTYLTPQQAFRAAVGQVVEYAYLSFERIPHMIIFLDHSPVAVLNLLFLIRGEWGSIGDFVTTQRALRAIVGDDLLWAEPQKPSPAHDKLIQ